MQGGAFYILSATYGGIRGGRMTEFTASLKDRGILFGWIAGLLLAAALLWSLSYHFRAACLMRSVNRSLIDMQDDRRLVTPLRRPLAGQFPLGCWYTVDGTDSLFFVFTIMRDGILVPCGAEISAEGKVKDIVPVGSHARQVLDRIPRGVIHIYTRRIESAFAVNRGR